MLGTACAPPYRRALLGTCRIDVAGVPSYLASTAVLHCTQLLQLLALAPPPRRGLLPRTPTPLCMTSWRPWAAASCWRRQVCSGCGAGMRYIKPLNSRRVGGRRQVCSGGLGQCWTCTGV